MSASQLPPLDLCYRLSSKTLDAAVEALAQGRKVLVHNHYYRKWQDEFDTGTTFDGSWTPFMTAEELASLDTRVGAALLARTLPARQQLAKEVLKQNPSDPEARLLLLECLPSGPAKAQALLREARKAAITITAALDAAPAPGRAKLGPPEKHALRCMLAFFEQEPLLPEGSADDDVGQVFLRLLNDRDEDGTVEAIMPWCSRLLQAESWHGVVKYTAQLLVEYPTAKLTMTVWYSLLCAAYHVVVEGGQQHWQAALDKALAGAKKADPQRWVPKLLAGLVLADPVPTPSMALRSKQEAMMAVKAFGEKWSGLDEYPLLAIANMDPTKQPYTRWLLQAMGVELGPPGLLADQDNLLNTLLINTGNCMGALLRTGDVVGKPHVRRLARLRTCVIMLHAYAANQCNLPPIGSHPQHWLHVARHHCGLGGSDAEVLAAMQGLLRHSATFYADVERLHETMLVKERPKRVPPSLQQEMDILDADARAVLGRCKLRCLWQNNMVEQLQSAAEGILGQPSRSTGEGCLACLLRDTLEASTVARTDSDTHINMHSSCGSSGSGQQQTPASYVNLYMGTFGSFSLHMQALQLVEQQQQQLQQQQQQMQQHLPQQMQQHNVQQMQQHLSQQLEQHTQVENAAQGLADAGLQHWEVTGTPAAASAERISDTAKHVDGTPAAKSSAVAVAASTASSADPTLAATGYELQHQQAPASSSSPPAGTNFSSTAEECSTAAASTSAADGADVVRCHREEASMAAASRSAADGADIMRSRSEAGTSGAEPGKHAAAAMQQTRCCVQCGAGGRLKKCAGCAEVYYCSAACQRQHWLAGHKAACSRALLSNSGGG